MWNKLNDHYCTLTKFNLVKVFNKGTYRVLIKRDLKLDCQECISQWSGNLRYENFTFQHEDYSDGWYAATSYMGQVRTKL